MSTADPVPWGRFSHDPRRSETARLRASDRDREVVVQVLGEAYADGRLDREEYDERAAHAQAAKTLGDLPPIVADLVPETAHVKNAELVHATPEELQERAVAEFRNGLRNAISGFVIPSVICVVIWFAVGFGSFFWPAFVMLGTGINVIRMLINRTGYTEEERRNLEQKQRKALEAPQAPHDEDD